MTISRTLSRKGKFRSVTIMTIRLMLAGVFLYAGAIKLWQEPGNFADSIDSFRLLPPQLVGPVELALPSFELLTGILLLAGRPRRLGAFCGIVLGAVFLFALTTALARQLPVDCHCFGVGPDWLPLTVSQRLWLDLGRDGLLMIGALLLYRHEAAAEQTGKHR